MAKCEEWMKQVNHEKFWNRVHLEEEEEEEEEEEKEDLEIHRWGTCPQTIFQSHCIL